MGFQTGFTGNNSLPSMGPGGNFGPGQNPLAPSSASSGATSGGGGGGGLLDIAGLLASIVGPLVSAFVTEPAKRKHQEKLLRIQNPESTAEQTAFKQNMGNRGGIQGPSQGSIGGSAIDPQQRVQEAQARIAKLQQMQAQKSQNPFA